MNDVDNLRENLRQKEVLGRQVENGFEGEAMSSRWLKADRLQASPALTRPQLQLGVVIGSCKGKYSLRRHVGFE